MTNKKLFTNFESCVDDAPDRDFEVELANMVKGKLEAELKLEITKKLDTSLTSTVGGNYLTAYSLAGISYFELYEYIYVGTCRRKRVPFERRMEFKDDGSKFYVNLAANTLHLCGTIQTAQTITIPYIYDTPAITDDETTVVVWPSRFHMLIPLDMARMWPAIEGGDKNYSWDDRYSVFYKELKDGLIGWDASQKVAALGGETPYGDSGSDDPHQINF